MDEFSTRASIFFRENLLAVICFGVGLIFLVYGLIAFSGIDKKPDVVFESSASEGSVADVKGDKSIGKIVVDVAGAVSKPGVYRLVVKSRIEDALLAAGGVSADADQSYIAKNVNLASVLTDGAKVYIPFVNENSVDSGVLGQSALAGGTSGLINLNSATSSQLEELPGIGVVTAGKIISARPYSSVEELIKKKTVSQRLFDQIKEKVSVY